MKSLLLILIALSISVTTLAEEAEEIKYGTLDQRAALFNTDAARDALAVLKKEFGNDEQLVIKLEEDIKNLQTKLATDQAIMTAEEIEKLRLEGQGKVQERAVLVEKLKKAQADARNKFVKENQPLLAEAIKSVVEELKLEAVFDAKAVIYAESARNITELVAIRINEIYNAEPVTE